jgi:hypothetical protein
VKCWLLLVLCAGAAWAEKPRGFRDERIETGPTAITERTATFGIDLGGSLWSSSLISVLGGTVSLSLGHRFNKHVGFFVQVDFATSPGPRPRSEFSTLALSAGLTWDVLELVRAAGRKLPIELGPEFSFGALWPFSGEVALLLAPGVFARYRITDRWSLGARLRLALPLWGSVPVSFSPSSSTALPGLFGDPAQLAFTISAVHVF